MTLWAHNILFLVTFGMLWETGFAQPPASEGEPPFSSPVGSELVENLVDEPQSSLPKFQVEVIAFAYGPFDPSEEIFPVGRGPNAKSILNEGTRRIPSFGLNEQTMEDLFGPAPQSSPEELLSAVEILQQIQLSEIETTEQMEIEEPPIEKPNENTPEELKIQLTEFLIDPPQDTEKPPQFRLLQPDELRLMGSYARLRAISAYTPLFHGGWVQDGLPEEEAQPFDVTLLGAANPKGTITLYLSRFLHLTIDLRYYAEARQPPSEEELALSTALPAQTELRELELTPRYELVLERRIRSGQLSYFDHPAFGVLVEVRPQPEETEGSQKTGEPAA